VTEKPEFLRHEICQTLMGGMKACACVPLKSSEVTIGLLHLACASPHVSTENEQRLLSAIAEMAGTAFQRTTLHEQTREDARSLAQAYDATIEGWGRALELRDEVTEGHTRRVAELGEALAREMGMSGKDLIHIRRGAILHDIGKMGIPDAILHNPGKLSAEEWEIMRKHPVFAMEILSPISHLEPALDIPYCHHEKWDGTGYPRGLIGEQIPLAARVFAVVDVFDALINDRPYRKAWSVRKALAYIRAQSGAHFDPSVVETFLNWYRKKRR
jgi:putative nucleotidyltransferase with HDIG domain